MVKSYSIALAATAILFAVAPAAAYEYHDAEARDLGDYSGHMARDLSSYYQFEAREPMDFEGDLYARDKKEEHKDHRKPFFKSRKGRKARKSRLAVLKKTCGKLENKDKDECMKQYKEVTDKTMAALNKYRPIVKKLKADKKKKADEERKKKEAEKKKKDEEAKKKKEEEAKKKKEEEAKKKKEEDDKKKKEEEEKKKKEEEERKKKAGQKRDLDDLEDRDLDYESLLSIMQRAYDDSEDLYAREYLNLEELD
ncbi:hypothetical protein PC9H_006432 [Pleurotus ostreatus]|uniref:Uncharacterized protein n=1 Tax=Pleurotus ostreatus TaxID=5322 RepID=A0A8H7A0X0_PLEOS|nr:uncharacterized protein PC9H_006432 [Pleurotus ostreatus]KAF7430721.1 hypothetical protein PC9H_006432 [Pleurotus ostreatus]KAJ8695064.1 hypothetical protein PTI98_007684 [Pleurotus ostreatus]